MYFLPPERHSLLPRQTYCLYIIPILCKNAKKSLFLLLFCAVCLEIGMPSGFDGFRKMGRFKETLIQLQSQI